MAQSTILQKPGTSAIVYVRPAFETVTEEEFFDTQVTNVVSCGCWVQSMVSHVDKPITGEARPCKNDTCQEYVLGRAYVVHNADRKEINMLNETASRVYEQCDGTHTVYAIAESLAVTFPDQPMESLLVDVKEVIGGFIRKGVVRPL